MSSQLIMKTKDPMDSMHYFILQRDLFICVCQSENDV